MKSGYLDTEPKARLIDTRFLCVVGVGPDESTRWLSPRFLGG